MSVFIFFKRFFMIKKFITVLSAMLIILGIFPLTAFADYENTYRNTGVYADDIVGVALTQAGYKDADNFKYGNGDNNSLIFLQWCADRAYIPSKVIPDTDTVSELYDFFISEDQLFSDSMHKPKKGDIMFIGENDGVTECAIVISSDEDFVFAVICEDDYAVRKKMYTIGISKILGYASPDYSFVPDHTPDGSYRTIASNLNFRKEPNTSCEILATIPLGTIVEITECTEDENWGQIEYNGVSGWISMDYVVRFTDRYSDSTAYSVYWDVIDVSKWQGNINWAKIADTSIRAVILRIGLRGSATREILMDERFLEYYKGAKAQGLYVGCYFYSTAKNDAETIEEAKFIINAIKEYDLEFDMPVFLDMEDSVTEECGKSAIYSMTKAFLDKMDKVNIYSGVYCSRNWAGSYYNDALFDDHALWIADWSEECKYEGDHGMWQYTDEGGIGGVDNRYTDLNICYRNYPRLIADKGYNILREDPDDKITAGDVNSDGKITASDARLALRISANLHSPTVEERLAADYNLDGKVTASDARKILRKSANLE